MKKYFSKQMLVAAMAISAAMVVPSLATAKVSGPCGDCHTMHNSQDGSAMASTGAFGAAIVADTDPNGALLRYGCIGCHTGDNTGGDVPFVLASSEPTYGTDTLAGGNFYWVNNGSSETTNTDATGHNVKDLMGIGVDNTDGNFTNPLLPPGGSALSGQLTCAGTNGCHGHDFGDVNGDEFGSISGGHHGDGGNSDLLTGYTITSGDATDMSDAFRMLAGIKGIEENGWEYSATATKHNQYYGVDRTDESDTAAGSISSLCANCHGDFHNGADNVSSDTIGSPWVRHPTDFDMAGIGDKEYQYFNGSAGGDAATADYSLETPLASTQQSAVLGTVSVGLTNQNDTAIVMCLSCHRAHGSPYDDLLRWKYSDMDAHNATVAAEGTGCFRCHTTKDDA